MLNTQLSEIHDSTQKLRATTSPQTLCFSITFLFMLRSLTVASHSVIPVGLGVVCQIYPIQHNPPHLSSFGCSGS